MMKPIRDILPHKWFFCTLSIFALVFQYGSACAESPEASNLTLWDTGTHFSDAVNVTERSAWKAVPSDLLTLEADPPKASSDPGYYGREYSFRGDAVVENHGLLAVFWAAKGSVVVFAKPRVPGSDTATPSSESFVKVLELKPTDAKASTSGSSASLSIVRNADDEVVVKLAFDNTANSSLSVGFDRTEIIAVNASADLAHFNIRAPFEYAAVPSFIGDDLIFGAQDKSAGDTLSLTSDNLLVGLLSGESTEFVMTWPRGKQKVQLRLAQENNERRSIESLDFDNDGQNFYLAPLAAPGIWHREVLSPAHLEKEVPAQWKRPFPARWKTQLLEEAVRTTFTFRAGKGEIWRGVPGSYDYPVWFDGDQAYYHLSKKVPPKGESLIYFLEGQSTPPVILTPADILKETLGRTTADSILDIPGRKLRTHHRRGGDGVHRACTCGCTEAIQAVFEAHEEVERKDDIKGDLEDMVYFVHAHVNRINEYRRFAEDLIRDLDSRKAAAPELSDYIDGLEQIVRQIPQECTVQQENMKSFVYADELVQRTLALTDKKDPENLKAYMELLKDWRAMGGAQDYVLAQCHIVTRKLAQEAGYGCATRPKAVALAQEIRARARLCLRNPDGYEIWADY